MLFILFYFVLLLFILIRSPAFAVTQCSRTIDSQTVSGWGSIDARSCQAFLLYFFLLLYAQLSK